MELPFSQIASLLGPAGLAIVVASVIVRSYRQDTIQFIQERDKVLTDRNDAIQKRLESEIARMHEEITGLQAQIIEWRQRYEDEFAKRVRLEAKVEMLESELGNRRNGRRRTDQE